MVEDVREHLDAFPELQDAVDGYLVCNGWTRRTCSCGVTHYFRRDNDESCQRYACLGEYRFLAHPAPRSFRTPVEVWDRLASRFDGRGYATASPAPVENEDGTTFFTVAGIQAFDDVLFGDSPAEAAPALVAQPSIRTGSRDLVGERDGITTSFVNLTTVRTDGDVDGYVADLDAWLDVLSELGLFVSDCSLVTRTHVGEDWGTGRFDKYALTLNYGGLELGEMGLLREFPRESGGPLTVIDFGFSLERICWALNRTPSFPPVVGPIRGAFHHSPAYLDLVRTVTLMAAGQVTPAGDGAGYRFRRLVDELVDVNPTGDCTALVRYYHAYWRRFAPLLAFEPTRQVISRAVDRQYNRRFSDLRNAPAVDADTESFLREVLGRGSSMETLSRTAVDTEGPDGE